MTTTETTPFASKGGRGARERILKATVEQFAREGIHATGIAKLTEAAHVSTRTLYQHFPSKEALVGAYLERLVSEPDGPAQIENVLLCEERAPRDRLLDLFEVPADEERPGGVIRGCPFHNTVVEAAGQMPEASAFVERHKRELAANLTDAAAAAGAADPAGLGAQLALLFEGARALATSLNETRPFRDAQRLAQKLIDEAVPQA